MIHSCEAPSYGRSYEIPPGIYRLMLYEMRYPESFHDDRFREQVSAGAFRLYSIMNGGLIPLGYVGVLAMISILVWLGLRRSGVSSFLFCLALVLLPLALSRTPIYRRAMRLYSALERQYPDYLATLEPPGRSRRDASRIHSCTRRALMTSPVPPRPLSELINTDEPALPLVLEWVSQAVRTVELLPPSVNCADVLFRTQVTTRSPLGAIVYETGGILIDGGWLRLLGSGHQRLTRTLPDWNEGRANGFYLVADDAVGGFFALNGRALGPDEKNLYYFAPDSLDWEPMAMGFSDFFHWACVWRLDQFYEDVRWPGWEEDVSKLHGDRCYQQWPPRWSTQGQGGDVRRFEIPVSEAWDLQMDIREQLGHSAGGVDSTSA